MTDYMNCGFCTTRHPIEQMGEHGWGICGDTDNPKDRVVFASQWVLEHWNRTMDDHDGWQDILEDVTEALFPQAYGELMAKDGDFTEEDESTMMRSETKAEVRIMTEFIARFAFLHGISSDAIARAMEANE